MDEITGHGVPASFQDLLTQVLCSLQGRGLVTPKRAWWIADRLHGSKTPWEATRETAELALVFSYDMALIAAESASSFRTSFECHGMVNCFVSGCPFQGAFSPSICGKKLSRGTPTRSTCSVVSCCLPLEPCFFVSVGTIQKEMSLLFSKWQVTKGTPSKKSWNSFFSWRTTTELLAARGETPGVFN